MLDADELHVTYKTNFILVQLHKHSMYELEAMVPFERDMMVEMIADLLEKEALKANK